jgi:hypothetical protein
LRVNDRALQHPVKAQGLLRFLLEPLGKTLELTAEKLLQSAAQPLDIAAAVYDGAAGVFIIQQREKKMLETDVFMAPFLGFS